jgi:hypothetical protein
LVSIPISLTRVSPESTKAERRPLLHGPHSALRLGATTFGCLEGLRLRPDNNSGARARGRWPSSCREYYINLSDIVKNF